MHGTDVKIITANVRTSKLKGSHSPLFDTLVSWPGQAPSRILLDTISLLTDEI